MPRTRIKICGITNARDADTAVRAGADALGFMMYEGSRRFVEPGIVADIVRGLPPFVTSVGVFVDPSPGFVSEMCGEIRFDVLQFHGDEDDEFCDRFERPWVKAISLRDDTDLERAVARYPRSGGLLLDSRVEGMYGGTGQPFDWNLVTQFSDKPLILAGGLTAANVGEAINKVKPYCVDVSSGVERDKGIKDSGKIRDFVAAVKSCDEQSD